MLRRSVSFYMCCDRKFLISWNFNFILFDFQSNNFLGYHSSVLASNMTRFSASVPPDDCLHHLSSSSKPQVPNTVSSLTLSISQVMFNYCTLPTETDTFQRLSRHSRCWDGIVKLFCRIDRVPTDYTADYIDRSVWRCGPPTAIFIQSSLVVEFTSVKFR